ncbi:Helix-turn-helix domain-containing protein [Sinomicrobium oceani]|uniref:Helix-turn-helix domain-containing protein n=1 Tax=Sinomicrobium oceani TaxID=1150368 RepID=A0A1K1PY36_9FLAO|nr:helix-turn-helix transcriptional regulator [Sinomicrobium oceani]SFW52666.1 Helix-turn-helix domain-containing protein [Sinomicrobium oceani]
MEEKETLEQYYSRSFKKVPDDLLASSGSVAHFNIIKRQNCLQLLGFSRRDYYKVVLTRGNAVLYTEKGEVTIDRPSLFFSDRNIRYGWKNIGDGHDGYICLFNEYFASAELRKAFRKLFLLFKDDMYPFLFLTDEQYHKLEQYFVLMRNEYCDNFGYKNLMLRDLLNLVIYTGIKIKTSDHKEFPEVYPQDLAERFMELLDNQFPVESPVTSLQAKTPARFADLLHVHVNHLNHSVKLQTGKTTSQLIRERVLTEAMSLLRYSDWRIYEIGNSLGFEYPQHFNSFFRKLTGTSPKQYRSEVTAHL